MRENRIIKNKKEIKTNRQWFNAAPPTGGKKQWVPLHSASELADYFLHSGNSIPSEIDEILDEINISKDICFTSVPEHQTVLDPKLFGINGPRNHDLLMIANNKEVVIGIEAKATESLDKYVSAYKAETPNSQLRYNGLCEQILNKDKDQCANIRYQLLSAAAGTLIEAELNHSKKAVVLVILFNSKIVSSDHILNTKSDIDNFKKALSEYKKLGKDEFETPFKPGIKLYVRFIVVDVCSYQKRTDEKL